MLRSADLDAAVLLWGNLFLFLALGTSTVALLVRATGFLLARTAQPDPVTLENLGALGLDILAILARILLPLLAANWLVALANQLAQHGLQLHTNLLQPKFSKLNPASGFKRLLSIRSGIDLIKSLLKFVLLAWVTYAVLAPRMPAILATMRLPLGQDLALMQDTLFVLYRNIMMALLVVAAADFLWQRHQFEEGMKMTKQEVKDEAREAEGNPEIKSKQKSMLIAAAVRRITTHVPRASVVITNPTHFAVALRYGDDTAAPVLVAKGVDHMALKIRERAQATGVPVVENPPLARAVYRSVDLDQPIPAELYQAVAQVLAYVYHLKRVA